MKATVISVVPAKKKTWSGFDFTYQGEPFDGREKPPTTRFIFQNDRKNPEVPRVVQTLNAGDAVDLTFEKNGQYSNLVGITVVPKPAAGKPAASYNGGGGGNADRDTKIMRAVALKAAADLTNAMAAAGNTTVLKKAAKPEIVAQEVIQFARQFESYLSLEDDEVLAAIMGEEDDVPFDQESFDE